MLLIKFDLIFFSCKFIDDKVIVGAQNSSTSSNTRSPTPDGVHYYSNLNQFTYQELKSATGHFAPECFLGEGGFGSVYKGWIGLNGRISSRPGMGVPVAVKTLNKEGNQGHKEWLVCILLDVIHIHIGINNFYIVIRS
jgi:hypothetical protein